MTIRLITALVLGFLVSTAVGAWLVPYLRRIRRAR